MADSRSLVGWIVLSMMACLLGESAQLSFESIRPFGPCNSSVGLASLSARGSDVPIPRTITFFDCVPVMMKPPIKTLSPVSTRNRVEMFANVVTGVAAGVAVADGGVLAVRAAVAVRLCVEGGVAVGVGVGSAVLRKGVRA